MRRPIDYLLACLACFAAGLIAFLYGFYHAVTNESWLDFAVAALLGLVGVGFGLFHFLLFCAAQTYWDQLEQEQAKEEKSFLRVIQGGKSKSRKDEG